MAWRSSRPPSSPHPLRGGGGGFGDGAGRWAARSFARTRTRASSARSRVMLVIPAAAAAEVAAATGLATPRTGALNQRSIFWTASRTAASAAAATRWPRRRPSCHYPTRPAGHQLTLASTTAPASPSPACSRSASAPQKFRDGCSWSDSARRRAVGASSCHIDAGGLRGVS